MQPAVTIEGVELTQTTQFSTSMVKGEPADLLDDMALSKLLDVTAGRPWTLIWVLGLPTVGAV
jgi:hypothetical protein